MCDTPFGIICNQYTCSSVIWCCWTNDRKGHPAHKKS